MDTAATARRYLHYAHTMAVERRGPHRFHDPDQDHTELFALAKQVAAAVDQTGDREFSAPDPWTAAAWLLDVAALVGQHAEIDGASGLRAPHPYQHGAPLFRGQADPAWGITTSLARADDREARTCELAAFARAMTAMIAFEEIPAIGPLHHASAAQHHGFPTPLLDLTTDPRVAVFFACGGPEPTARPAVAVYWLPFSTALSVGLQLLFPPPWVQRLYAQRGLFLDLAPGAPDIEPHCFRLVFPSDPAFAEAQFDPGFAERLLPEDRWYDAARRWAEERCRASRAPTPAEELARELRERCGDPGFLWDSLAPARMIGWFEGLLDMCEWIALKVVDGAPTYDCYPLVITQAQNPDLFSQSMVTFQLFLDMYGEQASQNPRLMHLLKAIRGCADAAAQTAHG